jgi:hypothetical protein
LSSEALRAKSLGTGRANKPGASQTAGETAESTPRHVKVSGNKKRDPTCRFGNRSRPRFLASEHLVHPRSRLGVANAPDGHCKIKIIIKSNPVAGLLCQPL